MDSRDGQRSAWRQEMHQIQERIRTLLAALDTQHSTFAGVVYQMRTRCGKPSCACAREGLLHTAWCVAYLQGKRRRHLTIPTPLLDPLRTAAERYRVLRAQRAELNRLVACLLDLFDRLERSLRLPPARLLPRKKLRPSKPSERT